jgi:tetratricopeptide (TPR) repeat protein
MDPLIAALETELERWTAVVRRNPNNPQAYIRRGMAFFQLAQIEASIWDFDRAEKLNPEITPFLWQRGLAYYYANCYEAGAQQFELDLTVNSQDVEETVWRYLCLARGRSLETANSTLLEVRTDPRPVMCRIYDFYAGHCAAEDVLATGREDGLRGKFYSHLYLGLYAEAAGDADNAQQWISTATNDYAINDYMWHVARVHLAVRGWRQPARVTAALSS